MQSKKESMKKFEKALSEQKVDREMLPVLKKINNIADYHTTSSCAGRINLFEIQIKLFRFIDCPFHFSSA